MPNQNDNQQIQLPPNALVLLEQVSLRYDALIPQGVEPAELLKPAFWAHEAIKLQPMNEIRARAEDGTWIAYYVVLDCSRTWARVHQLSFHRLTTGDQSMTQASELEIKAFVDAHTVMWRGPHKWSVVRKLDKEVLQEGMDKDMASAWLASHARTQVLAKATAPEPVAA